jgi:hypothetical protein
VQPRNRRLDHEVEILRQLSSNSAQALDSKSISAIVGGSSLALKFVAMPRQLNTQLGDAFHEDRRRLIKMLFGSENFTTVVSVLSGPTTGQVSLSSIGLLPSFLLESCILFLFRECFAGVIMRWTDMRRCTIVTRPASCRERCAAYLPSRCACHAYHV